MILVLIAYFVFLLGIVSLVSIRAAEKTFFSVDNCSVRVEHDRRLFGPDTQRSVIYCQEPIKNGFINRIVAEENWNDDL